MIEPHVTNNFMANVPHLKTLGIRYRNCGADWAELEMPFAPELVAYPETGVVASGAIYSLVDSTAGLAVIVTKKVWTPQATLDLRLDYLRAPKPQATIIGHATCYKMTRTLSFVRGFAHDGDPADPLANMVGTFMFTAAETPRT